MGLSQYFDVHSFKTIRLRISQPTNSMTHPTKLTLRLDSGLVDSAKAFAHDHHRSVSQLVADYFARLSDQPAQAGPATGAASSRSTTSLRRSLPEVRPAELSPVTQSLRGVLKTKSSSKSAAKNTVSADTDKAAYRKSLEEKYL